LAFFLFFWKNNYIFVKNKKIMTKVGLYFGSFNPVHNGHMMVANYALSHGEIDELWFIPTVQNPQKDDRDMVPFDLRCEMLIRSINTTSSTFKMTVCDIERNLPSPHYTYQTLNALKEKYPDINFVLILGWDSYETIHSWGNFQELIKHDILIMPRISLMIPSKMDMSKRKNELISFYQKQGWKIGNHTILIDMPLSTMSSSFIRQEIKTGNEIRYYVPHPTWVLITENNLYVKKQ
jgi:nicotinate-nucleotide adenylyltransferase